MMSPSMLIITGNVLPKRPILIPSSLKSFPFPLSRYRNAPCFFLIIAAYLCGTGTEHTVNIVDHVNVVAIHERCSLFFQYAYTIFYMQTCIRQQMSGFINRSIVFKKKCPTKECRSLPCNGSVLTTISAWDMPFRLL